MPTPTTLDWADLARRATRIRERLSALDAGQVATRAVGGAMVLAVAYLMMTAPRAAPTPDPSAVVAARIAPVGTVQLAQSMIAATIRP